jgi:predicted MFS family arabinose efflux permease
MSAGPADSPTPATAPPPVLWLFAFCNFVIGTGAFGLSGYLGPLSQGLGVSVSAAGQTMTAYALANALLAPFILWRTGAWARQRLMLLALGLFTLGAWLSALAPNLSTLMAGRVLMGMGAVFTPVAAGVAVALVAPQQRGKALSRTFLGMSLSYVLGMPVGAWLGLEFGWRWPLVTVGSFGLLMWLLVARFVPRQVGGASAGFAGLGRLLRQREVVLTLGLTLLYFCGIFVVSAYMGPIQLAMNPLTATQLSWTLLALGLGGVTGTLLGGWTSDRFGPHRSLRWQVHTLLVCMAVAPFTAGHLWLTVAVFTLWSVCGFGMMTPQQSRLAEMGQGQTPMLMSVNASMVYIGTAIGAALGGAAIPWIGFVHLPWIGGLFVIASALTLWPRWSARPPGPVRM